MFFFRKIPKSRDPSSKQSQELWLSQSRPMGHKSLRLLGLGQKSLGQSLHFERWDSSPWDKQSWKWQSRPMPIPANQFLMHQIYQNKFRPLNATYRGTLATVTL